MLDYEHKKDKNLQIQAFANTYVLSRQKYKFLKKKKFSETHYQIIDKSLLSSKYLSSNSFFEACLDREAKRHHWRGISLTHCCATSLLPGSPVAGKVPLVLLSTMLVLKKKSKLIAFITRKKKESFSSLNDLFLWDECYL